MQTFRLPQIVYVPPYLSDGEEREVFLNRKYNGDIRYGTFWSLKNLNNITIFLHFLQALIILILCFTNLDDKPTNIMFLSSKRELTHTNYALIDVNKKEETCDSVKDYSNTYKSNILTGNFNELTILTDILPHNIFDFNNKTFLKYNIPDYHFETNYALVAIFALSVLFQAYNGMYMGFEESFPRVIYNIEESISGGLIVMILALYAGITEVYTIATFFAIIFAMNICNLCADVSSWFMSAILKNKSMKYLWLIPQITAWILLFFVFIPIIINLEKLRDCSSHIPNYVVITIYVQFIFFILEQIAQTFICLWRSFNSEIYIDYYSDISSILYSAISKTFLAWMFLIPTLNAQTH